MKDLSTAYTEPVVDPDENGEERADFDRGLVRYRPNLIAFACSLGSDFAQADDLVQETLMRALANRHRYIPGTNQCAWLFTILRNLFLSQKRRDWREVELTDHRERITPARGSEVQEEAVYLSELCAALGTLPRPQRTAIVLVAGYGYSLSEVAERERCPVGTIKSRMNRARRALRSMSYETSQL